jgi:ABC-type uncharacterized transport system substrate-binding protein
VFSRATQPDVKAIGTVYDSSNQNLQVWVKAVNVIAHRCGLPLTRRTLAAASGAHTACHPGSTAVSPQI